MIHYNKLTIIIFTVFYKTYPHHCSMQGAITRQKYQWYTVSPILTALRNDSWEIHKLLYKIFVIWIIFSNTLNLSFRRFPWFWAAFASLNFIMLSFLVHMGSYFFNSLLMYFWTTPVTSQLLKHRHLIDFVMLPFNASCFKLNSGQ